MKTPLVIPVTDRLILSQVVASDIPVIYSLLDNVRPYVDKYMGHEEYCPPNEATLYAGFILPTSPRKLAMKIMDGKDIVGLVTWLPRLRADAKIPLPPSQAFFGEVGYLLMGSHLEGNGYVSQTVPKLLDHTAQLGCPVTVAKVGQGNDRSTKSLIRMGFKYVGIVEPEHYFLRNAQERMKI